MTSTSGTIGTETPFMASECDGVADSMDDAEDDARKLLIRRWNLRQ